MPVQAPVKMGEDVLEAHLSAGSAGWVVNDKRCNVAEGIATLHEDTAVVGTGELLHEAS